MNELPEKGLIVSLMVKIPQVQDFDGVYLIDSKHNGYTGTIGVFLVPSKAKDGAFLLVETGPASTLSNVEQGINQAGFNLEKLSDILVTHIHLDHAGAAGVLSSLYGARVYIHQVGVKHLLDPSKLIASAKRIYQEKMSDWGEMLPVASKQLTAVKDGDNLNLLGHDIKVIYTPGHASHHVCYLFDEGIMFTGDAAGVKVMGSSIIRPALPPPEVNLEAWEDSLTKMAKFKPDRLMLTHFDEVTNAKEHFSKVKEANGTWAEVILAGMQSDEDDANLAKRIRALSLAEFEADKASSDIIHRHQVISSDEMTVAGLKRYWLKHHPEKLSEL